MTHPMSPIKPDCTETFYYDINDYLQKYYTMQLTKTSECGEDSVLNTAKVVRTKTTSKSNKANSMKNHDELLASYRDGHIYTKDRLAQTSAKVTAFYTRDVNSSAQIRGQNSYESKKMVIPMSEITLSLDDSLSAINYGKNITVSDKNTSNKKQHRINLPLIKTDITKKTSGLLRARPSINACSTQKSHATNNLPKM